MKTFYIHVDRRKRKTLCTLTSLILHRY